MRFAPLKSTKSSRSAIILPVMKTQDLYTKFHKPSISTSNQPTNKPPTSKSKNKAKSKNKSKSKSKETAGTAGIECTAGARATARACGRSQTGLARQAKPYTTSDKLPIDSFLPAKVIPQALRPYGYGYSYTSRYVLSRYKELKEARVLSRARIRVRYGIEEAPTEV